MPATARGILKTLIRPKPSARDWRAHAGAPQPAQLESMKMPVVYDTRVSASLLGHLSAAISGSAIARGTSFCAMQWARRL